MTMVVGTILKWYFLGFMQAINFVSRKQEFRADELACLVAGPKALTDGLRAIAGTSGAWPFYWKNEVVPVLNNGCRPALGSGFAQFVSAPGIAPRVQEAIEKQIREGKTGAYDTHPPLRLRIEALEHLSEWRWRCWIAGGNCGCSRECFSFGAGRWSSIRLARWTN